MLWLGCATRYVAPAFDTPAAGPFWPPAPDAPRIAWVGELRPPTGRFVRPMDVACGTSHHVAVADTDNGAVWVFDLPRKRVFLLTNTNDGPLSAPVGVTFDGAGGLYVMDARRGTVLHGRDDKRGRLEALTPEGQLTRPTSIVSRPDGSFLLVDAGSHTVARLERDGSVTPIAAQRGEPGAGLNFPVDVAVGRGGDLFVADALNGTISRIDAAGAIRVFAGGRAGTLVRPKGVAFDHDGALHVVDGAMQHVEVYDEGGRLLGRYGEPGEGPGQLGLPAGICVDGDGHIFIADSLNGRVAVYAQVPPVARPAAGPPPPGGGTP
jgi:DNA-binding beta-propeller fold protein YncE